MSNLINLLKGVGHKYMVDTVLLETSGIAQPSRFLDNIKHFLPDESTIKVVTLADATRWKILRQVVEELVNDQVRCADLVLVNKVDAVDEQTVQDVIRDIDGLKPGVKVLTMSASKVEEAQKVAEVIRHV